MVDSGQEIAKPHTPKKKHLGGSAALIYTEVGGACVLRGCLYVLGSSKLRNLACCISSGHKCGQGNLRQGNMLIAVA